MIPIEIKDNLIVGKVLIPSFLVNILSLAIPLTVLQIYDRILPNQSYGTALLLLIGAITAVFLEAFIRFARGWFLNAAASNTEIKTYRDIINSVASASPSDVRKLASGEIEEGLDSVGKVKDWYSGGLLSGLIDFPFALLFLALIFYIGGSLVFIPISIWVMTLIVIWILSSKVQKLSQKASEYETRRKGLRLLVVKTLQGIKRQAIENRAYTQFKKLNQARHAAKSEQEYHQALTQEIVQLASLTTSVIIVLMGSIWVINGELTTGGLAACSLLAGRSVAPLTTLVNIKVRLNSLFSANEAISKLKNLKQYSPLPTSDTSINEVTLHEISIARYGASYEMNMSAAAGNIVLIQSNERHVDSMMLSAIAGVDEAMSGDLLINGNKQDISKISNITSYCGVKGQVITGSLLDNLCGFNPELSESAYQYAIDLGLAKEISSLHDGLETKVGKSSNTPLSMGNIKLLNIAAQLAMPTPLLALDRPDTSLDITSIEKLAEVLEGEARKGRILLLVTHHPRLKSVATVKCIVSRKRHNGGAA